MRKIYLDNASTTKLDNKVLDCMMPYLKSHYGNPSSIHSYGRHVKSSIESARRKIADIIGAIPSQIFFTSGGTEGNNAIIKGYVECLSINHIITSRLEHHAVLNVVEYLSKNRGVKITYLDNQDNGNIDLDILDEKLSKEPKIVSFSNEC